MFTDLFISLIQNIHDPVAVGALFVFFILPAILVFIVIKGIYRAIRYRNRNGYPEKILRKKGRGALSSALVFTFIIIAGILLLGREDGGLASGFIAIFFSPLIFIATYVVSSLVIRRYQSRGPEIANRKAVKITLSLIRIGGAVIIGFILLYILFIVFISSKL